MSRMNPETVYLFEKYKSVNGIDKLELQTEIGDRLWRTVGLFADDVQVWSHYCQLQGQAHEALHNWLIEQVVSEAKAND